MSFFSTWQGPPGKDGLPGHPGQRGETVSPEVEMSSEFEPQLNFLSLKHLFL